MGSRKTRDGVGNAYAAAEKWVDRALRSDDSLFTPGKPIWTSQWLGELRERFLDRPEVGGNNFDQKLEQQLADSPPEVYQLMGEVLYFHFLIVSSGGIGGIKPSTKENGINQVLGWSRQPIAIPSDLVTALEPGIATPGVAFNRYRQHQVGFLIEFAEQWKKLSTHEHQRLLAAPWAFKNFLVSLSFRSHLLRNNQNTPRIQREALLHLVFPDTFDPIVSADDKRSIADSRAFAHLVTDPTDDLDRRIQQIRKGLEVEVDGDFDFYDPDVRTRWKSDSSPWDEFVRQAKAYFNTGRLERDEINYKIEIGRKLELAREALHAGSEDWAVQVDAALPSGNIIHYVPKSNFSRWLGDFPDESKRAFQALWTLNDSSVSERIRAFGSLFPDEVLGAGAGTRMNVISVLLMGLDVHRYPPYAYRFLMGSYNATAYSQPPNGADEAELYEHAIGFFDQFIEEAFKRGLEIHHRLAAQSLAWAVRQNRGSPVVADATPESYLPQKVPNFHSLAQELTLPAEFLEEVGTLLDDKKQVIFQGPPGTGKTFVAQKLANHLAGSEDRVTLVQFHPSYSYEDFVQGFRPTLLDSGQPGFKLTDGPLIRSAKNAEETDAKHFLIIDEINRGSLARILGELYFLLEYRDEKISLQYQSDTDEKFSLPDNLYIIGTMNTADRSIALVDLALRRRFYFVDFHPDDDPVKSVLRNWLKKKAPSMEWVANVVDAANEKLKDDRHAAIGPSYFMKSDLDEVMVERIWKHSVLPYIEERLFGEGEERIREFDLDKLCAQVTSGPQPESDAQDENGPQDGDNAE